MKESCNYIDKCIITKLYRDISIVLVSNSAT